MASVAIRSWSKARWPPGPAAAMSASSSSTGTKSAVLASVPPCTDPSAGRIAPEGHGDHPLAGVPAGRGVGPELLEVSGSGIEGGLFEQFPAGGCLGVLVWVQEAAGQGESAEEWWFPAFDQEQLETALPNREHGDVGRDGEGGVGEGVVGRIRCHTSIVLCM